MIEIADHQQLGHYNECIASPIRSLVGLLRRLRVMHRSRHGSWGVWTGGRIWVTSTIRSAKWVGTWRRDLVLELLCQLLLFYQCAYPLIVFQPTHHPRPADAVRWGSFELFRFGEYKIWELFGFALFSLGHRVRFLLQRSRI